MAITTFVVVLMGVIDFGRFVYIRSTLLANAQDAARQAALVANKSSDCSAFTAGLNQGGGVSLSPDPLALTGQASFSPSGAPAAANTGYVYLFPAVSPGPVPQNTPASRCTGASPRTSGQVRVQITYKWGPVTPFLNVLVPSATITASASVTTEY